MTAATESLELPFGGAHPAEVNRKVQRHLEMALSGRVVIEQAKGALMFRPRRPLAAPRTRRSG